MISERDPRQEIYSDLQRGQLVVEEEQNYHSAVQLLGIVRETIPVNSVLDAGCGVGSWLRAAQTLGISDVLGIEGPWLDRKTVVIDPTLVRVADFEKPFSLGRRFDLAVCLEVAEHLSAPAAPHLVASLVEHAEHVLFSAAIPKQGGYHHVNEQFPDYWARLFAHHHYVPVDMFRGRFWKDTSILWWLRQNLILFASATALAGNEKLREAQNTSGPLSVVHPELYLDRLRRASQIPAQLQELLNILKQGGVFEVEQQPDGSLRLQKLQELNR